MRPLAAALLLAVPALAAEPEKPPTLDEQIKKVNLSDAETKVLKEHKFVVGQTEYRQVFSPYLGGDIPRFITADSLLNAFHVVFEESVFRLEQANARTLPTILAAIAKQLPAAEQALAGDAGVTKKAGLRARVFLGTAVALLDPEALPADAADRKLVEEEVKRVTAATETEKPAWLGPPDEGFLALNYSRFKPRGFYTRTPKTEAYFRAVSWLQAIPWRVDKDEEFAAILLLAHAYNAAKGQKDWIGGKYWGTYEKLLGTHDDWQIGQACNYVPKALTADALAESRKKALKDATEKGRPQINDQLRFPPDTPDGKAEANFRFVSAYRLPDAVLIQLTADPYRMPSGLDVAAALGSPFAREKLRWEAPDVLKTVDFAAPLFPKPDAARDERRAWSLYAAYLDCLRELLARTEVDAPGVFKSEAWSAKTCQTALGGWAQMRHTWVLQAKQDEELWSAFRETNAGFVEPVPEFYAKFVALMARTREVFRAAGAFSEKLEFVPAVTGKEAELAAAGIAAARKGGLTSLTNDQRKALEKLIPGLPASGNPSEDALLDRSLQRAELEMKAATDAEARARLERDNPPPNLDRNWRALEELSAKLESLTHKQLRGAAWRDDEKDFILGYGKDLARIMFYDGDSYDDPKDDAPRVVDVHRQKGKSLEVGIGRPRAIWVAYPWKGSEVLCHGAVLPYHEFASSDRLTDKQWLKLLDSSSAPEQPKWVKEWTVPKKEK